MFSEENKCPLYLTKKKDKNCHYISEDTMTKVIATHICNVNEVLHWHIYGHTIRIYRLLLSWPRLIRDEKPTKYITIINGIVCIP